jgi:hypothetical protein
MLESLTTWVVMSECSPTTRAQERILEEVTSEQKPERQLKLTRDIRMFLGGSNKDLIQGALVTKFMVHVIRSSDEGGVGLDWGPSVCFSAMPLAFTSWSQDDCLHTGPHIEPLRQE